MRRHAVELLVVILALAMANGVQLCKESNSARKSSRTISKYPTSREKNLVREVLSLLLSGSLKRFGMTQ